MVMHRLWQTTSALVLLGWAAGEVALAVEPNPLESAYWRFEEGSVFSQVSPRNEDVVLDSINNNHLRAFLSEDGSIDAAPTYVSQVPPTPLKSGLPNNLALDFIPNQDLFSLDQNINNGIIAPGGGFTVEAAFNANLTFGWQAIVGKEGRPGEGDPDFFIDKIQTFVVKTRGDNAHLMVEQFDGSGTPVQVNSIEPLDLGQWYYFAAVNDGSTLSLWLDSNDGMGYQLQDSTAVSGGALYQGPDPNNPSWDHAWTIGRGQFDGFPADWFDGIIDEVRLTNRALSPSEFLFAPPVEPLVGDYNEDGFVDAADYTVWRDLLGGSGLPNEGASPGVVDEADYEVWRANFGNTSGSGMQVAAVPEPAAAGLFWLALAALGFTRRR